MAGAACGGTITRRKAAGSRLLAAKKSTSAPFAGPGERWLWSSVNPPVEAHPCALVPEQIDRSILVLRGHKVLLDEQLAAFYGVETRAVSPGRESATSTAFAKTSCFDWRPMNGLL